MKTLNFFFTLAIFLLSNQIFSQKPNEIRIYYGISDTEILREPLLGGASYSSQDHNELGIRYIRQVFDNFHLETGVNYTYSDIKITPEFMGSLVESRCEKFDIISIPIYANYTLWKYLFVNGGPIVDFQVSENSTDKQSGIGYSLGFGGKYYFKNVSVYINPNFKRHAVIPFEKEKNHQKLTEFGIQFGVGLSF